MVRYCQAAGRSVVCNNLLQFDKDEVRGTAEASGFEVSRTEQRAALEARDLEVIASWVWYK